MQSSRCSKRSEKEDIREEEWLREGFGLTMILVNIHIKNLLSSVVAIN